MVEGNKLVKKVKRLIKRLSYPRWLHRFGPKTYEFYEHVVALLVRFFCRLSYRRVKKLLDLLTIRCPSKSALQYTAAKLDEGFWHRVLKATSGGAHHLIAIDSTGLSRKDLSYYYLRRIDGKIPRNYVKLSMSYDTRKKKICAAKVRIKRAHDIRDAKFLLKQSKPKIVVADKGYSSEALHEFAFYKNILLMIHKKAKQKRILQKQNAQKIKNANVPQARNDRISQQQHQTQIWT